MSTPLIPVFVYGTLRNPLGNYERILRGNTVHEESATLAGATMYDAGGFPFVSLEGTGTVIGEVMHLDPAGAEATMRRLDGLEGFYGDGNPRNMYDRKQVSVTLADGDGISAWAYLTAPGFAWRTQQMRVIASGDWKARRGLAMA